MNAARMGPIKYVVLIFEEALEPLIDKDLIACGAKGYTVSEARGRGHRGVRDAQWMLSGNVRIEVLCNEETAWRIVELLEEKYAKNYGLVSVVLDALGPRADQY